MKHLALALYGSALLVLGTYGLARAADPAPASDPVKPYPLPTCVISGEKIGSMGEPYAFVHEGQEIKMCCSHCRPTFNKDPAKYLKLLDAPEGTPAKDGESK